MYISAELRDILIEHLDGLPVQVVLADVPRHNRLRGASQLGMIRFNRRFRPSHSTITEKGREILAKALGDWADALSRAETARNDREPVRKIKRS